MDTRPIIPTRWLLTRNAEVSGYLFGVLPALHDSMSEDTTAALLTETIPVEGFPAGAFIYRCLGSDIHVGSPIIRVAAGKGVMLWPYYAAGSNPDAVHQVAVLLREYGIGLCLSAKDCAFSLLTSRDRPDLIAIEYPDGLDLDTLSRDMTGRIFAPPGSTNSDENLMAVMAAGVEWLGEEHQLDRVVTDSVAPEIQGLIHTLGLTYADVGIVELADAVKHQPVIVEKLLRAANTPAYILAGRKPLTTIPDILQEFGVTYLRKVCRLAMETVMARMPAKSAVLMLARIRAMFMERLAVAYFADAGARVVDPEEAFMIGMISMLPAIVRRPLDQMLVDCLLPARMTEALTEYAGFLGQLLLVAERHGGAGAEPSIFSPRLDDHMIEMAYAEAVSWAFRDDRDVA